MVVSAKIWPHWLVSSRHVVVNYLLTVLSGRDVNSLSIARWLKVRDTGDLERGAAQLEIQQREMKSCNNSGVGSYFTLGGP